MRRRTFLAAFAAAAAAPLLLRAPPTRSGDPSIITLSGSGPEGRWFAETSLFGKILTREIPGLTVNGVIGKGVSIGNIRRIAAGAVEGGRFYLFDLQGAHAGEGTVCYSGDSGPCEELIELAHGCDLLIHMNHHFSGTEPTPAYRAACGNHRDNAIVARRAGVKALVLTHLLPEIDRPGVRERIVREIQEEFDGLVIWGEDLMELTVPVAGV
ncbi:MAG: MBL fold metallo-hydrolase [Gemmatimonadota bacterium]